LLIVGCYFAVEVAEDKCDEESLDAVQDVVGVEVDFRPDADSGGGSGSVDRDEEVQAKQGKQNQRRTHSLTKVNSEKPLLFLPIHSFSEKPCLLLTGIDLAPVHVSL
jgi:hypothetical protein